jgi:hypothetical protein
MHDVERLIEVFRARKTSSVRSKLDALLDIERIREPRIVPFLIDVLVDRHEPTQIRSHVLKRLRNGRLTPVYRPAVADAILQVVSDQSSPDLRVQAALALAEFTDIDPVATTLGRLALDPKEPIDLRYSAFTSLQQAGPTAECIALYRELLADEALGCSARRVLSWWRSK